MTGGLPRRGMLRLIGGGLVAGGVAGGLAGTGARAVAASSAPERDWTPVAEEVRSRFLRAWHDYVQHAFGADHIRPISGGSEDFFVKGHSVGLSIVEAVDTLWLMGADAEVERAVRWIKRNLNFDIDAPFQVFETNIRMVGGLAAAYHCTGERRMLELAVDVADRLLPAFTASPTGLPYRYVNLATGAVSGPETNVVEVGTYATEFGALSEWTGRRRYYRLAKQAMRRVYDNRTELGLLPTELNAETGRWRNRLASVGPPADSYYETLWDGYALLGDGELRDWYETLTQAILTHQAERRAGKLWFPQVDAFTGKVLDREQSVLSSFYAGLLGESGHLKTGRAYHDAWNGAQDTFGVLPDTVDYASMTPVDPSNALRPEFVDSALALWLATGDEVFRERAYTHFRHMLRTSATTYGFAALSDVTTQPPTQQDVCPGYWWSEQMKYYWLLFSNTPRFDYDDNCLTTEANLLRGART